MYLISQVNYRRYSVFCHMTTQIHILFLIKDLKLRGVGWFFSMVFGQVMLNKGQSPPEGGKCLVEPKDRNPSPSLSQLYKKKSNKIFNLSTYLLILYNLLQFRHQLNVIFSLRKYQDVQYKISLRWKLQTKKRIILEHSQKIKKIEICFL